MMLSRSSVASCAAGEDDLATELTDDNLHDLQALRSELQAVLNAADTAEAALVPNSLHLRPSHPLVGTM